MMGIKLQIIIAIVVMIGITYIINLIRKNRLELKYALSWIVSCIVVLILDFFPSFMENMAELLGIASPVNMMFFFGFIFMIIISLTLTVALSINAGSVKRLNQKIAMLEKRVKELEEKGDAK